VHDGTSPNAFALFAPNTNALCYTSGCHNLNSPNGVFQGPSVYDASLHATRSNTVWPGADPSVDTAAPAARPGGDWGKCVNCHDAHGYNMDGSGLIPGLLVSREERLCYVCHDGSPADSSKNVKAQFNKAYRHPITTSGKHSVAEGGTPGAYGTTPTNNRHSECDDCHNSHAAAADGAPPVAPTAPNSLLGVGRVGVVNGSAGYAPAYTYRGPSDTSAPVNEYELCFKCHSSWTTQPAGQSNTALEFNPNNASYHPVEAMGKNLTIRSGAFVGGWTATKTMYCTDCHTSDDTAVRGPHGSLYQYILKKSATANSLQRTMASTELCFDCHAYNTYANNNSSNAVKGYSRFNPPQTSQGHTYHVGSRQYPCYACHESHGSATQSFLIATGRSPGITNYSRSTNGGTCWPTCHSAKSYAVNYPR
jgi:predicted CXXCH cytochrome family protein